MGPWCRYWWGGITCGWWGRKGVKCVEELGVTEEIGWGKRDVLGIFEWRDEDVSRWSIQVITISDSCYDICQHFDDGEKIGHAMPMCTN